MWTIHCGRWPEREASDLRHQTVSCGHFLAEEAPAEVVKELRALLRR